MAFAHERRSRSQDGVSASAWWLAFLRRVGVRAIQQGVLISISAVMIAPVYFILVTAFKTSADYAARPWGLPSAPTLGAFRTAFERGEILLWLRNSVIVSFGSVALVTVAALLAAYAISTIQFPGSRLLRHLLIGLMVVPPIVIAIPLFVFFADLGLINSFFGAILVFAGLLVPFSVYLLSSFLDAVPRDILEAAATDGASRFTILWRVVVPLALPALSTLLVINLLFVWNELLIVLIFLQGDELKTLAAGITVFQGRFFRDTPLVMAASTIVAAPMVIVYLLAQRAFIRGLTAGAVK